MIHLLCCGCECGLWRLGFMSLNVRLSIIIGRVKVGSGSSNSADGIALPHHRTRSVLLTPYFILILVAT